MKLQNIYTILEHVLAVGSQDLELYVTLVDSQKLKSLTITTIEILICLIEDYEQYIDKNIFDEVKRAILKNFIEKETGLEISFFPLFDPKKHRSIIEQRMRLDYFLELLKP